MEVDDLAEEWGFVFNGVASAGTGRGGKVGDDEEGARGVGDPGEAAEVGEEREGAVVGGGRRRDQMRWMEGERELRQRVLLPHRAGYCMNVGAGGGGGRVEFGSSPVAAADLPFSSRRPQGQQILLTEVYMPPKLSQLSHITPKLKNPLLFTPSTQKSVTFQNKTKHRPCYYFG